MDTTTITVGALARFKGYADSDIDPILKEGETVKVIRLEGDDIIVGAVNENGELLDIEGNVFDENTGVTARVDRVWENEIELLPQDADAHDAQDDAAPVSHVMPKTLAEVADFMSRNGIEEPEGWGDMKAAEKKAWIAQWIEDNAQETMAETEAEAVPTVTTEPSVGPDTDEALPATVVEDDDTVAMILSEKDAVEAALDLIRQGERTDFRLGGVLKHINEGGIYKAHGYEGKKGFEQFCQEHLGVAYRKARYLITNYEFARSLGLNEAQIERIGWSKFKEIARIPVEDLGDDIEGLLEYAAEHTRDELTEHIRENYEVATRAETVKTVTFTFKLVEDAAATVQQALDQAKLLADSDNPNEAFAYIVHDWMQTAEGSDLDLDSFVALAVSRFGADATIEAIRASVEAQSEAAPEGESAEQEA